MEVNPVLNSNNSQLRATATINSAESSAASASNHSNLILSNTYPAPQNALGSQTVIDLTASSANHLDGVMPFQRKRTCLTNSLFNGLYEGELNGVNPQGYGEITFSNGTSYKGVFDRGLPVGPGVLKYNSGSCAVVHLGANYSEGWLLLLMGKGLNSWIACQISVEEGQTYFNILHIDGAIFRTSVLGNDWSLNPFNLAVIAKKELEKAGDLIFLDKENYQIVGPNQHGIEVFPSWRFAPQAYQGSFMAYRGGCYRDGFLCGRLDVLDRFGGLKSIDLNFSKDDVSPDGEYGRIAFSNGVYEGYSKKGTFTNGKFAFSDGRTYRGSFSGQLPHGWGELTFPQNSKRYQGIFRFGDISQGTLWRSDRTCYKGFFNKGRPEGKGQLNYANGDVYEGDFKDGKPEGKGDLKYTNGDVYEGDFVAGIPHGTGKLSYANSDVYEGEFENNLPHGWGTFNCDEYEFEGWFSKGLYRSYHDYPDNSRYEGEFYRAMPEGLGKKTYSDGSIYMGNFKRGSPQGFGFLMWDDEKSSWMGNFNKVPEGEGLWTSAEGSRLIHFHEIDKK